MRSNIELLLRKLRTLQVLKVLISGLIAIEADFSYSQTILLERLEASVNSDIILLSDLDQFRQTLQLRSQIDPLFSGTAVAAKGTQAENSSIVEFLINENLMFQQYPVTDAEVELEINSIQNNNRITREKLKAALQEQGFTFEDYFELIKKSASKKNLIDRDIRTKVNVTDADIKNYFFNNFDRNNKTPIEYQLKIISFSLKSYKSSAAARDTANAAVKAISEGEPFEEVARRYSDDSAASSGGDLGILTEEQMSSGIREQVKKLKIGQVSEVFGSSQSGFFLIKLVDMKSSDLSQFEKVKDEIKNQLIASEYQHQITLWIERQRHRAFIHFTGQSTTHTIRSPE